MRHPVNNTWNCHQTQYQLLINRYTSFLFGRKKSKHYKSAVGYIKYHIDQNKMSFAAKLRSCSGFRSLTRHMFETEIWGFFITTFRPSGLVFGELIICLWRNHGLFLVCFSFVCCEVFLCFVLFFSSGFCCKGSGGFSSRSRSGRDKYGPPVRTEYRLIVENLSSRCSWQDLKVHDRPYIVIIVKFACFWLGANDTSLNFCHPSGFYAPGRGSDICWRTQGSP